METKSVRCTPAGALVGSVWLIGPDLANKRDGRLGKMRRMSLFPVTPGSAARLTGMLRTAPAPDLADVVEAHWVVRWDGQAMPALRHEVLPDPSVNLAVEPAGRLLYGVGSSHFQRELIESGMVIGTKFRPGGFSGFRPGPVSLITGFLRAGRPAHDPSRALVLDIVEAMRAAPPGIRVTGLAADFAVSPRTLQRLFAQHVGASPKQVLQRFRRHQAVELLRGNHSLNLSRLAVELGYHDQAHLARDFRTTLGRSPSAVAQSK